jgi:hypothetical protein
MILTGHSRTSRIERYVLLAIIAGAAIYFLAQQSYRAGFKSGYDHGMTTAGGIIGMFCECPALEKEEGI